ncbi:MAG TPA: flagellin, partial [Bacillota bacterium]|nr:flagellin [Bacillota bacterium]
LGAYQNRLEHTVNNLGTTTENLTAAESRIRDVDMAKEMMEFTKNNILNQAATAMLAQANQAPQSVLALLR